MKNKKEIVARTIEVMVRPILRFCLRYSVKLKDLSEVIKRAYVHVACAEIVRSGKEISASRVHVMTGVSRIDVARILEGRDRTPKTYDVATRVIGQWREDKRFLSPKGSPRVLTAEGMESEFVSLVRSVTNDLNPYTVLFELERVGLVERTRLGVKLVGSMYMPHDLDQGFALMADDVEDLMTAVQENVAADPSERTLHIKTEYDNIPPEKIPVIRRWVRRQGSLFHARVRDFLSRYDRDITPAKESTRGRVRVSVGSFSRIELLSRKKDDEA